jgi:hypothetical protein
VRNASWRERAERLKKRILSLIQTLSVEGFSDSFESKGAIRLLAKPIQDPKTGGWVGHVEEQLGTYISRISIDKNYSQRQPFDHIKDGIYRRLIKDFIEGAVMPEVKIAVLGTNNKKVDALDQNGLRYSIIDGLQRTYCYCIALMLVAFREALVEDACITADAWEYFQPSVEQLGERNQAVRHFLKRTTRYEVFYAIELSGLLHYMVTFNTGQRRMSLAVQLEIMQQPLLDELSKLSKHPIFYETLKEAGQSKKKEQFAAKDLVIATQAFLTHNPQVSAAEEADSFLEEGGAYLDDLGDVEDVLAVIKWVINELNPSIVRVYEGETSKQFILSGGGIFLIAFMAACGQYMEKHGREKLVKVQKRVLDLVRNGTDDPLRMQEYYDVLASITSSRGKTVRNLVYNTFLRMFNGVTDEPEWSDTFTSFGS